MFRKAAVLRQLVELNIGKQVSSITLNNPSKRNALSLQMIEELNDALTKVSKSDSHIVLLKSTGTVFSSGHDLKEMKAMNSEQQRNLFVASAQVFGNMKKMKQKYKNTRRNAVRSYKQK